MAVDVTGIDGIVVREDGTCIAGEVITDSVNSDAPHRDAIQIIPPGNPYAGPIIRHVEIRDCRIQSSGQLQGIFLGDGLLEGCWITDNVIDTRSQHHITLSILSGTIRGNRDSAGNLVPVRLNPLRIGGNPDGVYNVWIMTFSGEMQYRSAAGIVRDGTLDHVTDRRFVETRAGDVYLYDFDLAGFRAAAAGFSGDLRELAQQFGSITGVTNMSKTGQVFDATIQLGLPEGIELPVSIAFNNPGAIVDAGNGFDGELPYKEWLPHMIGRRTDLLRFRRPEDGIRAMAIILQNYQRRGLNTVRKMISRWAPCKGAGADNSCEQTDNYVRRVANAVGVSPDATVAVLDYKVIRAMVGEMIAVEGNRMEPYSDEVIRSGLRSAGIPMASERPLEVKPAATSAERKGAIVIGTGGAGSLLITALMQLGLSQEEAQLVADGAGQALQSAQQLSTSVDWLFWLTLANTVCLIGIGVGAWWWYRGRCLAGEMGLR